MAVLKNRGTPKQFVALLALLSGCATGLDQEIPPGADAIDVVDECLSSPKDNEENVELDKTIELTFNRMLDPGSVNPNNFYLFTKDGATVQTVTDSNGRLQPALHVSHALVEDETGQCSHPVTAALQGASNEPLKVSRLYITPIQPLMPNVTYHLYYGPKPPTTNTASAMLRGQETQDPSGILSLPTRPGETLAYVTPNTKVFTTGSDFSKFQKGTNDIFTSTYRIINSREESTSGLNFKSIVEGGGFIADTPTVSLQFGLTHANRVNYVDRDPELSREMTPTANSEAPGAVVFALEASEYVNDLVRKIPAPRSSNPADWMTDWSTFLRQTLYKRVKGKWRTTHGRKVLRFDPDTTCTGDPGACFYPNNRDLKTATQVFVAIIYGPGFSSTVTRRGLKRPHYIMVGAHISGFRQSLGISALEPNQGQSLLGGGR